MELYLQGCAAVLLALILILCLGGMSRELGTLLGLAVCCMVALIALRYLKPVLELLESLQQIGNLNGDIISLVLKAAGISLISGIAAQICSDSGNGSLAKTLELLGSAVILWLSIPLFTMLMELLESILGAI